LIPTETSRRIHTRAVSLVVSGLPRGQVYRRPWDLPPLRDPRSTVSDQGPHCEPPAEPICRPASGQRIVGSILRLKRVDRLFADYRVTCLHPDRVRRVCITGWGTERNRKFRLPAYGTLLRGGDLALYHRRVTTGTDIFLLSLFYDHSYFSVA